MVAAAAAQLMLGGADANGAGPWPAKALGADQWSEDAYGLLVSRRSARATAPAPTASSTAASPTLAEIGVEPSPTTNQLCRRVQGTLPVS